MLAGFPGAEVWGQWGVAGLLIGGICFAAWTLLRSVLQARDADLAWYRQEYATKRQEYLKSVEELQKAYAASLKSVTDDFHQSVEALCERLEHLEQRIEALLREVMQRAWGPPK